MWVILGTNRGSMDCQDSGVQLHGLYKSIHVRIGHGQLVHSRERMGVISPATGDPVLEHLTKERFAGGPSPGHCVGNSETMHLCNCFGVIWPEARLTVRQEMLLKRNRFIESPGPLKCDCDFSCAGDRIFVIRS